MVLIWVGLTLGLLTVITMWGGTPFDLVIFLFALSAGCTVWGVTQMIRT